MTETQIFEQYGDLIEYELNTKSNKNAYVKNDVITTAIKRCRGEKKRDKIKIDAFRKTLTIPESEISEGPEQEVKLKIGNIKENI